jgi:hypothetical protein
MRLCEPLRQGPVVLGLNYMKNGDDDGSMAIKTTKTARS